MAKHRHSAQRKQSVATAYFVDLAHCLHSQKTDTETTVILCQQSNNYNSLTLLPDGTDYLRDHCVHVRVVDCARVNALSSSQ